MLKGFTAYSSEIILTSENNNNPKSNYSLKVTLEPNMESTMKKDALLCDLCRNNASCIIHDQSKELKCVCAKGFIGSYCETQVDICSTQPCMNFGKCISNPKYTSGFVCECPFGFAGDICDIRNSYFKFIHLLSPYTKMIT